MLSLDSRLDGVKETDNIGVRRVVLVPRSKGLESKKEEVADDVLVVVVQPETKIIISHNQRDLHKISPRRLVRRSQLASAKKTEHALVNKSNSRQRNRCWAGLSAYGRVESSLLTSLDETHLSRHATTLLTPSSSSAYSSRETKARLLPSASWLAVTLT